MNQSEQAIAIAVASVQNGMAWISNQRYIPGADIRGIWSTGPNKPHVVKSTASSIGPINGCTFIFYIINFFTANTIDNSCITPCH